MLNQVNFLYECELKAIAMEGDLQEGERKSMPKRKPRMKMKRHRPKIFDLMKQKKKAAKAEKKQKNQKPKSGKRGRKRQKTMDSGNDDDVPLQEAGSCVSDPHTPEIEEKKNLELIEYTGFIQNDLERRKSPEIIEVYTRRRKQIKITNSDIISDSKFCDQFNNGMVLGGKEIFLKQPVVPKGKRSKRKKIGGGRRVLPLYRDIPNCAILKFLEFPVPKRKRWSILRRERVGNRIHYLPIDSVTSDFESKMKTPLSFDLNGPPIEENVARMDTGSSSKMIIPDEVMSYYSYSCSKFKRDT